MTNWKTAHRFGALSAILAVVATAACADLFVPWGEAYPMVQAADDASVTEAQAQLYREDAVRLALRRLEASGSPALGDVDPPPGLVNSLYHALLHVHAWDHPARDTAVDLLAIRTFPHPQTRRLMVRVDPAREWTQAWRSHYPLTGNQAVDALMTAYDIQVIDFFEWSIGDVALLRAGRPLNAGALADRFAAIQGVIWAEPDGVLGDGNDIRATARGDGWRLDYSVGYGDCPAGCIHRYTWSFAVSGAGVVEFLGTSGEPPSTATP